MALGTRSPSALGVFGALEERDADHPAVAHHERGGLGALDVVERGRHAHALLGEGLPAGERERRVAVGEAREALGVLGLHLGE